MVMPRAQAVADHSSLFAKIQGRIYLNDVGGVVAWDRRSGAVAAALGEAVGGSDGAPGGIWGRWRPLGRRRRWWGRWGQRALRGAVGDRRGRWEAAAGGGRAGAATVWAVGADGGSGRRGGGGGDGDGGGRRPAVDGRRTSGYGGSGGGQWRRRFERKQQREMSPRGLPAALINQ
eukprot:XP_020400339.1 glycine-rich cell wall structural protein 1.0-like [Zea mays]